MPSPQPSLDKLRREIDRIDDDMHDLLIRRTAIVEKIRGIKGGNAGAYLRPAREAVILRRLVARHAGHFPRSALVRIWREIMSALVRLQGPFDGAVFAPEAYPGYWDLARDHFGTSTPMTAYTGVGAVVRAVSKGAATIGVLPWPHQSSPDPWWRHLASDEADRIRVVARLPFCADGNGRSARLDAVAIACMPQQPTGDDRSFLIIESSGEISRSRFNAAMAEAGFDLTVISEWQNTDDPEVWLHLAEAPSFVAPDDPRIARLAEDPDNAVTRVIHAGGYAQPLAKGGAGPSGVAKGGAGPSGTAKGGTGPSGTAKGDA